MNQVCTFLIDLIGCVDFLRLRAEPPIRLTSRWDREARDSPSATQPTTGTIQVAAPLVDEDELTEDITRTVSFVNENRSKVRISNIRNVVYLQSSR